MRILFITDNFPPEVNAPATRTFEHCQEWVKKGADVTVVTCNPNFPQGKIYEGYKNRFLQKEIVEGIKVIRVWSYISPNKGMIRRSLDFLSFAMTSFLAGLFVKTDVIVATSPQFLAAVSGKYLSFFKRKPWIMEVRDLWPASVVTVGALEEGALLRFLRSLELSLYRSATKIVVVTQTFKEDIVAKGISDEKIAFIPNGANLSLYRNQPKEKNLLSDLGLQDKFVLGYIGTHGLAHKLEFLLDCARDIQDSSVHFLFIGGGARKDFLVEYAKELALDNVTFLEPVPKHEVWRYISILDAMVVPLKKSDIFKTVIPSKIFETAAMRVPILLGVDGEVKEIVECYNAGIYFEPENKKEFYEALSSLRSSKEFYSDIQIGCDHLAKAYNRVRLAKEMYQEILAMQSLQHAETI